MANSLPGSPIVGYYSEEKEDFEEHNRIIEIKDGEFRIKDTTKPYGFIDLNPHIWFAKYLDDDSVEREYLVTEGWIWTKQYPESQRIFEEGNNHSMELDDGTLKGNWAENEKENFEFFIINEAIITKLCILGEENEPCFEGATITAPQVHFSYGANFEAKMFSMMEELKKILDKGGTKVFAKYSVKVGDSLWNSLYNYLKDNFTEQYKILSVCEEQEQKFAVIQDAEKVYRLNFSYNEETFEADATLVDITDEYSFDEEPQFSEEEITNYENSLKIEDKSDKEQFEENEDSVENKFSENQNEEKEVCPKCGKPKDECECEEEKYNLSEIPEYVELQQKYSDLQKEYETLKSTHEELVNTNNSLKEFKLGIEKVEKQKMIDNFYMLSDEDKQEVVENIDKYSLDEIESKLSVLCFRNKVSYSLEESNDSKKSITYNLDTDTEDSTTPAWVKKALEVAKTLE